MSLWLSCQSWKNKHKETQSETGFFNVQKWQDYLNDKIQEDFSDISWHSGHPRADQEKWKTVDAWKHFGQKINFPAAPLRVRGETFFILDSVEKIVHFVQIFFVGSVEPIWSDTLRMFLGTLSDFSLRISFIQETWIKFRNDAHFSSSTILWSHSITFSQSWSKLSSRLGGKSSEATPLRHSFKRACCSELSVIVNWSLNFIFL